MTIGNELARIKTAKENIKNSIIAKGGTVADEKLDQYPAIIDILPEDLFSKHLSYEGYFEGEPVVFFGFGVGDVYIPDTLNGLTITDIRDGLFTASNITSVRLPAGLTVIYTRAFYGSSKLKTVEFNPALTNIAPESFYYCPLIQSVDLSTTQIKRINYSAFQHCQGLTTVKFPPTLTVIGKSAFANTAISGILTLPDNMWAVESMAFANTQITEVSIPSTCTYQADSFPAGAVITTR